MEVTDFRDVHLLGDEATTVPNLKDYYDIALERGFKVKLYTNGKYKLGRKKSRNFYLKYWIETSLRRSIWLYPYVSLTRNSYCSMDSS